jgi:hypothetical protein
LVKAGLIIDCHRLKTGGRNKCIEKKTSYGAESPWPDQRQAWGSGRQQMAVCTYFIYYCYFILLVPVVVCMQRFYSSECEWCQSPEHRGRTFLIFQLNLS